MSQGRFAPGVEKHVEERHAPAAAVMDHIEPGTELIVGVANAEPVTVIDAIEAACERLDAVRLHRMLPVRGRRYIEGEVPDLHHVSWFLGPHDKDAFHAGHCELVPNSFSDVPKLMRHLPGRKLALASVSAPDRHGYFSLGCHAEYVAAMIGEVPFFVEVNRQMPRTFGENQLHVSQVLGWCESDYPLIELPSPQGREADHKIAGLVAERIPDGATLQVGVGSIPDRVLSLLSDHRHLGAHTELISDGVVDLVEQGVLTGTRKRTHRNKIVTTTAFGSQRLYDFVADNPGVEFWPVDYTNDPRNIAREDHFTAINATIEVDFLGQCASESLGSDYWSSSGGQPDFARGAVMAENGQSFIVLHSTAAGDSISRIVPQLHLGAAVTTFKNIVDRVVTEYGVAELRGTSIRERTQRLIAIAHPKFRDELEQSGRELGYL
jgi:acyl-CoA hydrolase